MKTIICLILLNVSLFGQLHWPVVGQNGGEVVDLINSNFGEFRNTNRFHLGIDVQETPNTQVYPVTTARLVTNPFLNNSETYYIMVLEHRKVENENFIPTQNSYSVYIHFLPGHYNADLVMGSIVGPLGSDNETYLADGDYLEANHLHFNILTDLNGSNTNIDDDQAINPLSRVQDNDVRPHDTSDPQRPLLHAIYFNTVDADFEGLNYPQIYNTISEGTPTFNYHQIEYDGTDGIYDDNDDDFQIPRVLIEPTNTNSRIRLFVRASDSWNGGGFACNKVIVYIDQYAENVPVFNTPYYQLNFEVIPGARPLAEIVYNYTNTNTGEPLQTNFANRLDKYYRLFRHPSNDMTLPNQIVNDPINLEAGLYSEEGMHRLQVILKSDPYREENGTDYVRNETTGILYYYLLKNNDGYMDLSQSGTYN